MGLITPTEGEIRVFGHKIRPGLGDPLPHRQFRRGLRVPAAPVRQGQPRPVLEGHRPARRRRAHGEGAGDRRAGQRRQPQGPHLLAGHAAATGDRPGHAGAAGSAADGRTDQRARPAADPRHAGGAAPVRGHRSDRAGVQPPAVRGGADLQSRRRRPPGQDDRGRNRRRPGVLLRRDGLHRRRPGRRRRGAADHGRRRRDSPRPGCRPTSARSPRRAGGGGPGRRPAWRSARLPRATGWRTSSWR